MEDKRMVSGEDYFNWSENIIDMLGSAYEQ